MFPILPVSNLANIKELILPQENYCKTLKDMIIGIVSTYLLSYFQFFKVGQIMRRAKYGRLMLPGVFSDEVIPDIDFTDKALI